MSKSSIKKEYDLKASNYQKDPTLKKFVEETVMTAPGQNLFYGKSFARNEKLKYCIEVLGKDGPLIDLILRGNEMLSSFLDTMISNPRNLVRILFSLSTNKT